MRLVLDTNTALSGLLWQGTPGQLLDAAQGKRVELASSMPLLAELRGVLARAKFAKQLAKRSLSVDDLFYPRSRFVDDAAGRAYVEQVVPAGRLGLPEEIGELIRYLATMDGTFLTGAVIDFSGGWPVAAPFPS